MSPMSLIVSSHRLNIRVWRPGDVRPPGKGACPTQLDNARATCAHKLVYYPSCCSLWIHNTTQHAVLDHNRQSQQQHAGSVGPKTPGDGRRAAATAPPPKPAPAPNPEEKLLPQLRHNATGFQALGVLLHYLVADLEAFSTPQLKLDLEKMQGDWLRTKLELEEAQVSYRRLEETMARESQCHQLDTQQLQADHHQRVVDLEEQHKHQLDQLLVVHTDSLAELEKSLQDQIQQKFLNTPVSRHEGSGRLLTLKGLLFQETELLSRISALEESGRARLEELVKKHGAEMEAADRREVELQNRLTSLQEEYADQWRRLLHDINKDKDSKLQVTANRCKELQNEVQSLQTVLDLKIEELQELRRQNAALTREAEELPSARQKIQSLALRVEDLEAQLKKKTTFERQLSQENKLLAESFTQENKQKNRLSLHNEELQYKLRQSKECVLAALSTSATIRGSTSAAQTLTDSAFRNISPVITLLKLSPFFSTSSFITHLLGYPIGLLPPYLSLHVHMSCFCGVLFKWPDHLNLSDLNLSSFGSFTPLITSLFLTLSLCVFCRSPSRHSPVTEPQTVSPPASPRVKGVVEKSDSVSWVVEIDEDPEEVVSRLVRRAGSFRGPPTTPAPIHSPARARTLPPPKRQRCKAASLCLSSSATSISRGPVGVPQPRSRSRSVSADSVDNLDMDWGPSSPTSYHGGVEKNLLEEFDKTGDGLGKSHKVSLKRCGEDVYDSDEMFNHSERDSMLPGVKEGCSLKRSPPSESSNEADSPSKCSMSSVSSGGSARSGQGEARPHQQKITAQMNLEESEVLPLPPLPGGDLALIAIARAPRRPQEAAGEAMISEETSEDENHHGDDSSDDESSSDNNSSGSSEEEEGLGLVHGAGDAPASKLVNGAGVSEHGGAPLFLKQPYQRLLMSDSGSHSATTTTMDLSWSESEG
uniref:(California timema) hypothetical protein n=1 Tax=Timema californicum TaxID=61474 RepID=A0A7R9JD41_TIMCA|nr:unnamed protein product [Timema californicum]